MGRQPLSLKARAIGLLAQREHSRAELRRKLLAIERRLSARDRSRSAALEESAHDEAGELPGGGASPGDEPSADHESGAEDTSDADPRGNATATAALIDALLDTLAAEGYLDEARFVESRLHARAGRFGTQRILRELAHHGLKLDPAQHDDLRTTEAARAREVWLKRFGPEPATEPAEQARQTRFLLARGFSAEVVRRLLRSEGG